MRAQQSGLRRAAPAILVALALAGASGALHSQRPNPTSASNPFFGSVTARPVSDEPLKLSLDDAIALGLKNNLGLKEAEYSEKSLQGQKNQVLQYFLPAITLTGDLGVHQQNLVAMGFGPAAVKEFSKLVTIPANFSFITRDDLTEGKIQFGQMLFSGPLISAFKAVGASERAAHFSKMSARGEVVQQVATAYLHTIAASSEVDNARAQEATGQVLVRHAHEAHVAGVVANLDELRARVQLQAEQQALIAAQNVVEKDLILLKREIGIDPGQKIVLTDPAPYSDLASQTPEEVRAVAYKNRQDYLTLQNQIIAVKAVHAAYRSQRLPSLSFGGYYGVSQVSGAGSHGNFAAQGNLSFRSSARPNCAATRKWLRRSWTPSMLSSLTCAARSISKSARLCLTWARRPNSSKSPAPTLTSPPAPWPTRPTASTPVWTTTCPWSPRKPLWPLLKATSSKASTGTTCRSWRWPAPPASSNRSIAPIWADSPGSDQNRFPFLDPFLFTNHLRNEE